TPDRPPARLARPPGHPPARHSREAIGAEHGVSLRPRLDRPRADRGGVGAPGGGVLSGPALAPAARAGHRSVRVRRTLAGTTRPGPVPGERPRLPARTPGAVFHPGGPGRGVRAEDAPAGGPAPVRPQRQLPG